MFRTTIFLRVPFPADAVLGRILPPPLPFQSPAPARYDAVAPWRWTLVALWGRLPPESRRATIVRGWTSRRLSPSANRAFCGRTLRSRWEPRREDSPRPEEELGRFPLTPLFPSEGEGTALVGRCPLAPLVPGVWDGTALVGRCRCERLVFLRVAVAGRGGRREASPAALRIAPRRSPAAVQSRDTQECPGVPARAGA